MPALSDEGRAKVNLTLRVNGRRADGYHDLESVVAFADCADRLTLTPGPELTLKTTGPLASACGDTSDNLVLKAAKLLGESVAGLKAGSFVLEKILPVAAGIGGGWRVTGRVGRSVRCQRQRSRGAGDKNPAAHRRGDFGAERHQWGMAGADVRVRRDMLCAL